jgi:hypothetical protein
LRLWRKRRAILIGVGEVKSAMKVTRRHRGVATALAGAVAALLSLPLLAGCGCRDTLVFEDVLRSECEPPCWRGIIPEETTRRQVVQLLGREPEEGDPTLPRMSWGDRCIQGGGVYQVRIGLNSADVVVSIKLAERDGRYTFEDVVKDWGTPGRVMVNHCAPDTNLGYLYLAYPREGVAFATG